MEAARSAARAYHREQFRRLMQQKVKRTAEAREK
jgi:hypothetical protein